MTRTSFAAAGQRPATPGGRVRRGAARRLSRLLGMVLAIPAAVAAALAGIVFVFVLPVCGIGSIAEGVARASWRSARSAFQPPAGPAEAPGID